MRLGALGSRSVLTLFSSRMALESALSQKCRKLTPSPVIPRSEGGEESRFFLATQKTKIPRFARDDNTCDLSAVWGPALLLALAAVHEGDAHESHQHSHRRDQQHQHGTVEGLLRLL